MEAAPSPLRIVPMTSCLVVPLVTVLLLCFRVNVEAHCEPRHGRADPAQPAVPPPCSSCIGIEGRLSMRAASLQVLDPVGLVVCPWQMQEQSQHKRAMLRGWGFAPSTHAPAKCLATLLVHHSPGTRRCCRSRTRPSTCRTGNWRRCRPETRCGWSSRPSRPAPRSHSWTPRLHKRSSPPGRAPTPAGPAPPPPRHWGR